MHLPNNISAVSLSGEPEVLFRHPVFAKLLRREVQQFLIVQLSFVPLEVIHCPTIGCKEIRVAYMLRVYVCCNRFHFEHLIGSLEYLAVIILVILKTA